ncbi:hypothetical protein FE257_004850 [Aspergillus nanangensis]|uniref:NAD(P)-binding protein n=1 Tax=Aspergillus nanangensis TaxID=2582783 RepID=A0AAD4CRA0_ASPNN|nr:hypothetical protein FE257_004850 [Aspergillus nanangensis]
MTTTSLQVAIITGGTSGIGLAVGRQLTEQPNWRVYLIGTNEQRGHDTVKDLPRASFCKANVGDYDSIASVFQEIFEQNARIDFVFANAGVTGLAFNIYESLPTGVIPPKPNLDAVDINFAGVVWTAYLALHYFRQSPRNDHSQRNLIITGSCTSLYRAGSVPVYAGTKHALIGFARSIARRFHQDGIRVNIIAPGIVKTNFGNEQLWEKTPPDVIIPMKHILDVTLSLLSGEDMVDSQGRQVSGPELFGRVVEITVNDYYQRAAGMDR